jgi:thioredoxin reductase (NADPH)
MIETQILIIGAGPVGIFTVFQAGMLSMRCHVIDSLESIGGQCNALYPEKPIYDIPAHPSINGADLINQLLAQASPFEPTYHLAQQAVSLEKIDGGFIVGTSLGTKIKTSVIIIASGPGAFCPNRPPLRDIETYENKSVFYLINDKKRFKDQKVVIAGGGDSAVDWAISLSEIAERVHLVHRRDKFRAMPQSIKLLNDLVREGKILLEIGFQLSELCGTDGILKKLIISDLNGNKKEVMADILCPFFGMTQSLGPIADWGLGIDTHNIKVSLPHCMTEIEGIYAVGDVASYRGKLKLILSGFSEAAHALHHAYSRVFNGKALHFQHSTSKGISKIP